MKLCPPKPGFTVITSSKSILSRNGWTSVMDVGGLMASPTLQPSDRIFHIRGATAVAQFDVDDDFVRAGLDKWLQQDFRLAAH